VVHLVGDVEGEHGAAEAGADDRGQQQGHAAGREGERQGRRRPGEQEVVGLGGVDLGVVVADPG
jgi:hypothetical protein